MLHENLDHASRILVNNEIKKKCLEGFNFTVFNLQELGYSIVDLSKTATACSNYNGKFVVNCALHNVKFMKKFYFCNIEEMEWEYI